MRRRDIARFLGLASVCFGALVCGGRPSEPQAIGDAVLSFLKTLPDTLCSADCDTVYVAPDIGEDFLAKAMKLHEVWRAIGRLPVADGQALALGGRTLVFASFVDMKPKEGQVALAAHIRKNESRGVVDLWVEAFVPVRGEWSYSHTVFAVARLDRRLVFELRDIQG